MGTAIHHGGARGAGPMVAFFAPIITETMVEDCAFGHEKGPHSRAFLAPPGAGGEKRHHHGTLFIARIGDSVWCLETKPIARAAGKNFF